MLHRRKSLATRIKRPRNGRCVDYRQRCALVFIDNVFLCQGDTVLATGGLGNSSHEFAPNGLIPACCGKRFGSGETGEGSTALERSYVRRLGPA